jgi:hypothetical protein
MNWNVGIALAATLTVVMAPGAATAQQSGPTCSDTLAIEVHGQHVVGDYVAGIGHDLEWPISGREIGAAVKANRGAAVPGGPGPGFHFVHGVAPGASFCTDSQSPGVHP